MSTSSIRFYFIDVFAREPLNGNPLSLVVDTQDLSQEKMQPIAREFNQSETTFLLPPTRPEANWRLRSFTPVGIEVLGTGHNALGAWWWLADAGQLKLTGPGTVFQQEIGEQVLAVEVLAEKIGEGAPWRPTAIGGFCITPETVHSVSLTDLERERERGIIGMRQRFRQIWAIGHVPRASSPKLLLAGFAPSVTSYRTSAILVR